MKALIGCEYSGRVRDALLRRGVDAVSCDLLPTESKGPHIQGDVVEAVKSDFWDLIILHPSCTKLAVSGNRWYGKGMPRHQERLDALAWTLELWEIAKDHSRGAAMENPVSVLFTGMDNVQYIQPWQFGHMEQKKTGLALHNLPRLVETDNVYEQMMRLPKNQRERLHYLPPSEDRWKLRSTTFQGIADAMSEQWSDA